MAIPLIEWPDPSKGKSVKFGINYPVPSREALREYAPAKKLKKKAQTFGQKFAAERAAQGPTGTFKWAGKPGVTFTTKYKEEAKPAAKPVAVKPTSPKPAAPRQFSDTEKVKSLGMPAPTSPKAAKPTVNISAEAMRPAAPRGPMKAPSGAVGFTAGVALAAGVGLGARRVIQGAKPKAAPPAPKPVAAAPRVTAPRPAPTPFTPVTTAAKPAHTPIPQVRFEEAAASLVTKAKARLAERAEAAKPAHTPVPKAASTAQSRLRQRGVAEGWMNPEPKASTQAVHRVLTSGQREATRTAITEKPKAPAHTPVPKAKPSDAVFRIEEKPKAPAHTPVPKAKPSDAVFRIEEKPKAPAHTPVPKAAAAPPAAKPPMSKSESRPAPKAKPVPKPSGGPLPGVAETAPVRQSVADFKAKGGTVQTVAPPSAKTLLAELAREQKKLDASKKKLAEVKAGAAEASGQTKKQKAEAKVKADMERGSAELRKAMGKTETPQAEIEARLRKEIEDERAKLKARRKGGSKVKTLAGKAKKAGKLGMMASLLLGRKPKGETTREGMRRGAEEIYGLRPRTTKATPTQRSGKGSGAW